MAEHINTIPEMLRFRWETQPDDKAFNFVNKDGPVMSLKCGEIYTSAGKFASRLRRYGFETGDIIANGLPNSPERLITDMGIIMAGCVTVNCQVIEKDGSNFYNVARVSKCRGVIIPYRKSNGAYTLFSPYISSNPTTSSQCFDLSVQEAPSLEKAVIVNRVEGDTKNSLMANLKSSDEDIYCASPSPSDLVMLFATSGTTGFSKLVPSNHETIFRRARSFGAIKDVTVFTDRPMGWIGGFPFDFLAYGSQRFVQDQFDNLHAQTHFDLWQVMIHSGCTGATILPGTIYGLLDLFKDNPPETRLRFLSTGGQATTRKVVDAVGVLCNQGLIVNYGSTEVGMISVYVISDPSMYKDYMCGKPLKDVEVKIVDAEYKEVETGKEGHLVVKCPMLLSNYYNLETKPKPSDIFTPDGFFKTGDRAKLDGEGNLYCFGRCGDVVSMNGTLFYMSWPEHILNKCPLLQDSCVIGVEEENGNVFLCACVIPKEGVNVADSQVIEFFQQAVVDNAQQTSSMVKMSHVFIMDSFPLVSSGKVDKIRLKKTVLEKLGK